MDNFEANAKIKYQPLLDEKDNYFIWMHNFSLPVDDNLSERSLSGAKSKMKIAGQFQMNKQQKIMPI